MRRKGKVKDVSSLKYLLAKQGKINFKQSVKQIWKSKEVGQ